jgi:DNA-binding transcriptional MerR regulator
MGNRLMTKAMTIGRLAKAAGLSRSALLYYDRLRLLRPQGRSHGDYRLYTSSDVERLRRICCYRDAGIPLRQIAAMLDRSAGSDAESAAILEHHLEHLEQQVQSLRNQQRQVVALLKQITSGKSARTSGEVNVLRRRAPSKGRKMCFDKKENDMINKERWVEIMKAAGFSEESMHDWHRQFEKLEPESHREFLESLGIHADELAKIREWSRQ